VPIRHVRPIEPAAQQTDVIAFLRQPSAYPTVPDDVEVHETHGAVVFLAGEHAYKIKRAVNFTYMDYSTLEKRRKMIDAELRLNRQHAPNLYLGTIPITRESDGALALNGRGTAVEWAVHMRRFSQSDLLGNRVEAGTAEPEMMDKVADAIFASHQELKRYSSRDACADVDTTITSLIQQLNKLRDAFLPSDVAAFQTVAREQFIRHRPLIIERTTAGFVRRCHGDLHLNNIVVLDGKPTPFDAIEFNDDIAIIDTIYDLAFLLMDLGHAGQRAFATRILNRYLWRSSAILDYAALALLPLYLGLRSAVRAMVTAQRAEQPTAGHTNCTALIDSARSYLADAQKYLAPPAPILIAVGGFSGTGKSTLAAALAPRINPAPGAIHLRSDLERKAIYGVDETERLQADAYAPEVTARVYDMIMTKAHEALRAGHSVIIDAVFALETERDRLSDLAEEHNAPFAGLWLTAPAENLMQRVATRTGDASDATTDVVQSQLTRDVGRNTWINIDASGAAPETLEQALSALAINQ
jgi:aminoglycoside phosphotransferase family enzyme/gluconate kinase